MKQVLNGKVDTQKIDSRPIGAVNTGDTVEIFLDVEFNGLEVNIENCTFTLLSQLDETTVVDNDCMDAIGGNRVRLLLEEEYTRMAGLMENQLQIKSETDVSTVVFYFTINAGVLGDNPSGSIFVTGPTGPTGPKGEDGKDGEDGVPDYQIVKDMINEAFGEMEDILKDI